MGGEGAGHSWELPERGEDRKQAACRRSMTAAYCPGPDWLHKGPRGLCHDLGAMAQKGRVLQGGVGAISLKASRDPKVQSSLRGYTWFIFEWLHSRSRAWPNCWDSFV